ncbi:MAG: SDR family oxidoreductase [Anaerolineae bacterium]|nr:SDR family oxidoreductase [Anaerolineae bacterium]
MKRLLVTGAGGNLGRPLSTLAASQFDTTSIYYHHSTVGGGNPVQLDLREAQAVTALINTIRPDVIIHAAASERSDDMVETNRVAAINISQSAQETGARLIAISTDLVFDGTAPPYDEEAHPTPLSPYGRVKAENEQRFLLYNNCLIVRTSIIYDLHPSNNQVKWLQGLIEKGQSIPLFVDEIRQPIWAWNLAAVLIELGNSPVTGVMNVAGPQSLSRWQYGCALLSAMGHQPELLAQPVYAAQIAPQRPRDCTLSLSKARSTLKTHLLDLNTALALAREKLRLSGPTNLNNNQSMI